MMLMCFILVDDQNEAAQSCSVVPFRDCMFSPLCAWVSTDVDNCQVLFSPSSPRHRHRHDYESRTYVILKPSISIWPGFSCRDQGLVIRITLLLSLTIKARRFHFEYNLLGVQFGVPFVKLERTCTQTAVLSRPAPRDTNDEKSARYVCAVLCAPPFFRDDCLLQFMSSTSQLLCTKAV